MKSVNHTSATKAKRLTLLPPRLAQVIEKIGDPDRTRTCNHQLRRLVLYPVELRGPTRERFTQAGLNESRNRIA